MQPDTSSAPDAEVFFMSYLAAPIVLALYVGWKVWTRDWRLYIPAHEIDLMTGVRMNIPGDDDDEKEVVRTWGNLPKRIFHGLF